jgi:Domain of unknown function (DUF4386)
VGDFLEGASARKLARIAGGLYLINILGGALGVGIIPATLVVSGDASATAHNIQSNELLYRSSIVAHIVVCLTNVPLAVIFYDLFKVVNRRLALLVVFFVLVATAVEAAGLLNQFAPLVILGSGPYASALPPSQAQALAYMSFDLAQIGYSITSVFYGCYGICLGYVVFGSTFLPRAIGVLLAFGALSYLTYGVAHLLAPGWANNLVPWIQLPSLLGEGSFAVWLLAVGLDLKRWENRASAAIRRNSEPLGSLA